MGSCWPAARPRGQHADGLRLIEAGDRDAGLALLAQASREDPTNSRFRVDLLTHQAAYVRELLQRADEARRTGKRASAGELYAKALKVDPSSDRARRGLAAVEMDARHAEILSATEALIRDGKLDSARERVNGVLADNPGSAGGATPAGSHTRAG